MVFQRADIRPSPCRDLPRKTVILYTKLPFYSGTERHLSGFKSVAVPLPVSEQLLGKQETAFILTIREEMQTLV
jgi:hypothetical protein